MILSNCWYVNPSKGELISVPPRKIPLVGDGVGVCGICVGVSSGVAVNVEDGVTVSVAVSNGVPVSVTVAVNVIVSVKVDLGLSVCVKVMVGVKVGGASVAVGAGGKRVSAIC